MIIYGGLLDNGNMCDELVALDLELLEWNKIILKNVIKPLAFSACCTVQSLHK